MAARQPLPRPWPCHAPHPLQDLSSLGCPGSRPPAPGLADIPSQTKQHVGANNPVGCCCHPNESESWSPGPLDESCRQIAVIVRMRGGWTPTPTHHPGAGLGPHPPTLTPRHRHPRPAPWDQKPALTLPTMWPWMSHILPRASVSYLFSGDHEAPTYRAQLRAWLPVGPAGVSAFTHSTNMH